MPRRSPILRAALAAALTLGLAAAATAQPARGLDARLDRLATQIDLSDAQRADLESLAAEYAQADRAALWSAAADAAEILTDDQIDALREAVETRRGDRPGRAERRTRRGPRGGRGMQGARGSRGDRAPRGDRRGAQADLSADDREALRAIREDVREQTAALVADFQSGDLTEAALVAQVRAVRDAGTARAAERLPAEAAARMAERDARREAVEAARVEALGLTAQQQTALEALALQRVRQQPDLRPYLDADGRLDRQALREATRGDRREARTDRREAVEAILSDEQQDVAFLHRALAVGSRGRPGRGRR